MNRAVLVVSLGLAALVMGQTPTLPADLSLEVEPAQRAQVPETDFIFGFGTADQQSLGGNLRGLFVNTNPALATLPGEGVGQNLVTLAACAVNQPHVHPRGTEISHVTEGQLLFGFVEENANAAGTIGGRFISGNVTRGQTVIVPQGLIHFAQNLGCEEAQFIATFPNKDPGTSTIFSEAFLKLPLATIRATTGLSDITIEAVQSVIQNQVNPSLDPECLARCSRPPVSAPAAQAAYSQAPGSYLSGI